MSGLLRVLAVACALVGCQERVNEIQLAIASTRHGPPALLCRDNVDRDGGPLAPDASGAYLISRARDTGRVSVVVDFFSLEGGVPGCLPTQLVSFCDDHCCRHLTTARACIPVTLPTPPPQSPVELANDVTRALLGDAVTRDAPGGVVVIRAVVTTDPCSVVAPAAGGAPALDPDNLLGCAYSCPVVLDAVQGQVLLDLPVLTDTCGPSVRRCGTGFEEQAAMSCR